jgi:hypothetical protein
MEFRFEPRDLITFEQEAPVCRWMPDQLMRRSLEFQICEFMDLLLEFDLNFDLGILRIGLIKGFDS